MSCAKATAISLALLAACGTEDAPAAAEAFDPYTSRYELAQERQQMLWEVEQRAFLLSNRVAPKMADAIAKNDRETLASFFAEDFTVTMLTAPRTTRHGPVEERTLTEPEKTPRDRQAMVKLLTEPAGRRRVHFENLVPVDRARLDGAWRGTVTFQRITRGLESTTLVELDFARITKTPAADTGWIAAARLIRSTVRQSSRPLFEEFSGHGIDTSVLVDRWGYETAAAPVGASLASFLCDYDRDGVLDLLLCDRKVYLYRGKGDGAFEDVTRRAGLPRRSAWNYTGGTVLDCDNDGYVDLLLQATRDRRQVSEIWKNLGNGEFLRLDIGIAVPVRNGAVADFDNDGLVDVYLANAGPPPSSAAARWIGDRSAPRGVLLRNLGGFRFEDVTEKAGAGAGYRDIFAAQWLDVDNDGDADLLLANHMGDNPLLVNNGDGTFTERETVAGFGGFSMGLATGDLDGDGDADAYLANMSSFAGTRILGNLDASDFPPGVFELIKGFVDGNYFYRNDGGSFTRVALQETGWAYGPSLLDLDGDGLLDLYCPAGFQSVKPGEPDG